MRKLRLTILIVLTAFVSYAMFVVVRHKGGPAVQLNADTTKNPSPASAAYSSRPSGGIYTQIDIKSLSKQEIQSEVARRDAEDRKWQWKIPIRFYGKVVDEHLHPVSDAKAHFQWTDISQVGTSQTETVSDARGMFALNDARGKRLQVRILKDGYYTSAKDPISFEFANPYAEIFYTPNPEAPVIFHLRRKAGNDQVIIRSISPSIPYGEHRSTRIDLQSGRESPSGQLVVEVTRPASAQPLFPFDWRITLSIPNGGLIEHEYEFPFEAPETGYKSTVEYSLHAESGMKGVAFEKKFYFIIGQPQNYGRLEIRATGTKQHIFIDYVLNPSGSRDLEPASGHAAAR